MHGLWNALHELHILSVPLLFYTKSINNSVMQCKQGYLIHITCEVQRQVTQDVTIPLLLLL